MLLRGKTLPQAGRLAAPDLACALYMHCSQSLPCYKLGAQADD